MLIRRSQKKRNAEPAQKQNHRRLVIDPMVNPGSSAHRHQARPKADPTRPHHRMVTLAQSSPGDRPALAHQSKTTTVMLGPVSRIPAGILLIPMVLGAVLQSNGLVEIELPSWLLAVSYLLLGWTIGLRFTREILVYAIRALPKMIVSILMLIAFCGGLAFALVEVFDIDPLTAYLATSPGGADSVAIIAASTN